MRTYNIAPASCCISRFTEPRVGTVGKLEEDAHSSRDCRLSLFAAARQTSLLSDG